MRSMLLALVLLGCDISAPEEAFRQSLLELGEREVAPECRLVASSYLGAVWAGFYEMKEQREDNFLGGVVASLFVGIGLGFLWGWWVQRED